MTEVLVRPVLQARVSRRFTRTLTGFTVDVWLLERWNSTNQTTIDAYHNPPPPTLGHRTRCATTGCDTTTTHPTGICSVCRHRMSRLSTSLQPCEGPGCTTRTRAETRLCYDCQRDHTHYLRAVTYWYVCGRRGCGRATTNPACVCVRCSNGVPPSGPGNHWSLRWRNFPNPIDNT